MHDDYDAQNFMAVVRVLRQQFYSLVGSELSGLMHHVFGDVLSFCYSFIC